MRVRGVGGTTLDDVVSASKVSTSQLYRNFEDKPALVRAVIEFVGERTITGERERVAAVHGGYLLAQTSRDVTPMASAIDMAITHLYLLAGGAEPRRQSVVPERTTTT